MTTPYSIRLPDDIIDKLRDEAMKNERTLSKEIVWILKYYFSEKGKEKGKAN